MDNTAEPKFLHYICALPVKKRAGRIPQLISADPSAIEAFAQRWNIPGYGIYECVSLLRPGSTRRSLENVGRSLFIHSDSDLRALQEPRDQVLRRLQQFPPWLGIRDSGGGGFHLIVNWKEPLEAGTEEFERANAVRSRLTHILCADPAPNHAAALLRRPGSINFKYENPQPCCVIRHGMPADLTEVEDYLDQIGDTPLFTPTQRATNGHDRAAGEPRPSESRHPVDVEARLAAMEFQGAGDNSVHITQLHCTASLLRSGVPVEDAVVEVLKATRRAVANDPAWNWDDEKLTIERMCYDFVSKNPELAGLLPDKLFAAWNDRLAEGRTQLRIVYARHLKWHIRSQESKAESTGSANDSTTAGSPPGAGAHAQRPRGWNYFDTTEITPQRWCVKKIIPETGVGVLAGMWGSYKTTTALELAVSIMTGQLFANQYRIKRQGAVLYFATEGAGTLQSRLTAVAKARGAPDKLPFAWRCDCPALTDRAAATILNRYVDEASAHFRQTYNLPVSFVGIDTYINAANLAAGDDNDAAVTQRAFSTLRAVANHSGAFVLVVDHYGKVAEAGTRGSSAKEGNADTVLATLAEREDTGTISRTRMAARKQRDGMSGFEVPFTPEVIELWPR
jgi:AAA domain